MHAARPHHCTPHLSPASTRLSSRPLHWDHVDLGDPHLLNSSDGPIQSNEIAGRGSFTRNVPLAEPFTWLTVLMPKPPGIPSHRIRITPRYPLLAAMCIGVMPKACTVKSFRRGGGRRCVEAGHGGQEMRSGEVSPSVRFTRTFMVMPRATLACLCNAGAFEHQRPPRSADRDLCQPINHTPLADATAQRAPEDITLPPTDIARDDSRRIPGPKRPSRLDTHIFHEGVSTSLEEHSEAPRRSVLGTLVDWQAPEVAASFRPPD